MLEKIELEKFAAKLPIAILQQVMVLLGDAQDKKENGNLAVKDLENIEKFCNSSGFSLSRLGLVKKSLSAKDKKPKKPKVKSINLHSQYFYIEDGVFKLLKTHTMKKELEDQGISVLPYFYFEKTHSEEMKKLVHEANVSSIEKYNAKVQKWNNWAIAHKEKLLEEK